jgi:hypothetical protein
MSLCLLTLPALCDCASWNVFLFPKIKSMLEGTHFVLAEEVKAKTTEVLNIPTENDLCDCFEQSQLHMQLCLNSEGDLK